MKIVAITGLIGCGKTYIADILKSMGYDVFDVDKTVRFLYKKEDFLEIIKNTFKESVDEKGNFNKRILRNLVFNNIEKLKKLENIIHPILKDKLKQKIRKSINENILFLDVALLFEMKWDKYCDFIILADVDKNIQKQRVIKRDNITEKDYEKIIKIQTKNKLKKDKCDVVINTGKPKNIIKKELIELIEEII